MLYGPYLDLEHDDHVYFTIWLHLIEKMRNSVLVKQG